MFIETHFTKIIATAISIIIILIIRIFTLYFLRKFAKKYQKVEHRYRLVLKYFDMGFLVIFILLQTIIWGVNFKNIGLVFSSIFAIIGVALFAQWSILSNVTSGIIIFFTLPYKIGDTIIIHDKDFVEEPLIIEDIKAFQIILRSETGSLLSYPNSLILQKGVTMVTSTIKDELSFIEKEDKNLSQNID